MQGARREFEALLTLELHPPKSQSKDKECWTAYRDWFGRVDVQTSPMCSTNSGVIWRYLVALLFPSIN